MHARELLIFVLLCGISLAIVPGSIAGDTADANSAGAPTKVYVPYKELKGVFEKEGQGVFLPYKEFEKLWRAAGGRPADVVEAPFEYLISSARFNGIVKDELAALRLELTIDVLAEGWVQVPVGLGQVAVSQASLPEAAGAKTVPLLRVVDGKYVFVTKGKGRYVLAIDFVRQLDTKPGLHVLKYSIPAAAITTLELLIPEENLKVDVEPMLAATTSQVKIDDTGATKLQAFLGSARQVSLSWKPKTEAAAELEPVIVCEQFQHINVAEALISHEVRLTYRIHRGGVDSFRIRLPADFRVTEVSGANIARWDIEPAENAVEGASKLLVVKLFSPAKDEYQLTVRMERFCQEERLRLALVPIVTENVLRRSGLIGITYSPRRSVHLENLKNIARVDSGQLSKELQSRPGVAAYRFITSDYSAAIVVGTASPRISVDQRWALGIDSERLTLQGRTHYKVERTGVFELTMSLPEPWRLESVGPDALVDDYQLKGAGAERMLHVLLKKENMGEFDLTVTARAQRAEVEASADFVMPLVDANELQSYRGQLLLLLSDPLQVEVEQLRQLQSLPLKDAEKWASMPGLSPAMAFEFRAVDRDKPVGARFKVAVKPVQISATVHRLVDIQPGSIDQEAVVQYDIRYAPVDTFYLKMPATLADLGPEITDEKNNIKERPRIDELPPDQLSDSDVGKPADANWAYYRIVLQSKVTGAYQLKVRTHQPFEAGPVGKATIVKVEPILAAGRLSDQNGHIAISKAETLAVAEPVVKNLISADPGSAADLPYQPHRRIASLAFKYNAPAFELSVPVVAQKEAKVFTTIASGAVIEQVLTRDGMLNTHATYILATSRGERIRITLPPGAELTAVLLNGNEAPVEMGLSPEERIVRLPPSAGQISKFILEISCGLKNVKASSLTAPQLPEQIPVQQTLWRLWIPQDCYFLGHDRLFSRLQSYQLQNMLQLLGRDQPAQIAFKLPGQGTSLDFLRQGSPGELSVLLAGKELFSILLWVLIVAAGVVMLKLGGFQRVMVILAAALLAGIVHLYLPLLVNRIIDSGFFAGVLVLLLWVAHWVFRRLPHWRSGLAGRRSTARPQKQSNEKAAAKPQAPPSPREQSKQDQE